MPVPVTPSSKRRAKKPIMAARLFRTSALSTQPKRAGAKAGGRLGVETPVGGVARTTTAERRGWTAGATTGAGRDLGFGGGGRAVGRRGGLGGEMLAVKVWTLRDWERLSPLDVAIGRPRPLGAGRGTSDHGHDPARLRPTPHHGAHRARLVSRRSVALSGISRLFMARRFSRRATNGAGRGPKRETPARPRRCGPPTDSPGREGATEWARGLDGDRGCGEHDVN